MKKIFVSLIFLFPLSFVPVSAVAEECVILLHGLARTSNSMNKLEKTLSTEGFKVANINYPSREFEIAELAEQAMSAGISACESSTVSDVHIVTHSLGGILVRQYMNTHPQQALGRVVMLGPPNQGSEVVDSLKDMPGFAFMNGPAGLQLGTAVNDVPKSLGRVNFDLGVIAGTRTINLMLSQFLPNPDDGKVSLQSTKVEGMCAFMSMPTSHPMMMRNRQVIEQIISYLTTGRFSLSTAENQLC